MTAAARVLGALSLVRLSLVLDEQHHTTSHNERRKS